MLASMKLKICSFIILLGTLALRLAGADPIDPALQSKIDAVVKEVQSWSSDPIIVNAVKAHNAALPPDQAQITQEKWKALSLLDPLVRSFAKNPVADFLKTKKGDIIAEAFVSDAAGNKVAFLAKPSNWSHKGKPKHDDPMAGKTWQGPIERDDSTGIQQIQVALPILDGGKPIGSLVVGLSITKLSK